jgi:hypothetical protein
VRFPIKKAYVVCSSVKEHSSLLVVIIPRAGLVSLFIYTYIKFLKSFLGHYGLPLPGVINKPFLKNNTGG